MKKTGLAMCIVILFAIAWSLWPHEPTIAPMAPVGEPVAAVVPQPTLAPAAVPAPMPEAQRASSQDGQWWANGLLTPDAIVQEARAEDSRAGVLRGRLTVKQQPWRHPADVELRLTRSWLDSVIPVETTTENAVPQRDEVRTTSDLNGFFAFRIVPPATELFFLIGHGTEWEDFQKVPKLPRAGDTVDLGDVFLDQRGEITGRVVAYGRPVEGAVVRAVDDPLLDGTAAFEEVAQARLDSLEHFRANGATTDGPVPEWVVRRDRFLPFPRATTGRDGRFRLRGVRPGNHDVIVQAPNHGRSPGVLVAAGRTTEIGDVSPANVTPLQLRFVDETDKPWIGAVVVAVDAKSGFGAEAMVTDGQGRVTLYPSSERAQVYFAPSRASPWQFACVTDAPDRERERDRGRWFETTRTVTIARAKEIVVVLTDEAGRVIPRGTVRMYTQTRSFRATDRELPPGMQPRETEPGRYVGSTLGRVVLVASAHGFAPAMTPASPSPFPITMTMLPMQTMTVHVHDLRGYPVAGASVRARVHGNPELKFVGAQWASLANDRVLLGKTDENGDLEAPVWPSWFSFQASHRDFAPSTAPKVLPVPGERLDLLLLGGGEVRGTLTIASRAAPAGLRVRARQQPAEGTPLATSGYLDERLAVTGPGGTFSFRQLVAGCWELEPELPAVPTSSQPRRVPQRWRTQTVHLDEGQVLYTVLEIQDDWRATAQIEGGVLRNGVVVAGALVRIRELDPAPARERNATRRKARGKGEDAMAAALGPDETSPWMRCETDAFGEFSFRDLSAGVEHELRVDVPEGGRLQFVGRRVVRPGTASQPVRLDFALQASDVRITCLQDGTPFANRMVRLRQIIDKETEGARYELLLDGNGDTWIDQLPAGNWTIEPMHGGRCEPAQLTIPADRPEMFTIAVLPR